MKMIKLEVRKIPLKHIEEYLFSSALYYRCHHEKELFKPYRTEKDLLTPKKQLHYTENLINPTVFKK
jgi:hypothetical protein